MKNKIIPNEYYELARLLGITRDIIRKARQKELDQYNIHARRAIVLYMIDYLGIKATPVQIAHRLLRKRHTLSHLIIKMEQDGLVIRIKDFRKKNMVRVILTQLGAEKVQQSSKRETIRNTFSALSPAEQETMESILLKTRDKAAKSIKMVRTVPYIPIDDKTYHIYGLLIELWELIHYARQKELDRFGFKPYQSNILIAIQMLGDRATPTAVARRLLRSRSTLSEMLTKMENEGLIVISNDFRNKNGLNLALTKDGFRQYHNSLSGNILKNVFSILDEHERKLLNSYLQKLFTRASKLHFSK